MALPLLDTNILVRHFTADNAIQSPRASAFLTRVAAGEIAVRISDQVIFETAFTLEKIYKVPRRTIVEALNEVLSLDGVVLTDKEQWAPAFELFVARRRLSFVDCYHVAYMRRHDMDEILTWDREFDRVPGITRIEP